MAKETEKNMLDGVEFPIPHKGPISKNQLQVLFDYPYFFPPLNASTAFFANTSIFPASLSLSAVNSSI